MSGVGELEKKKKKKKSTHLCFSFFTYLPDVPTSENGVYYYMYSSPEKKRELHSYILAIIILGKVGRKLACH